MQQISLMGQTACKNIRIVYSSAGSILGAYAAILVRGSLKSDKSSRFARLLSRFVLSLTGQGTAYEVNQESSENPLWYDLSPVAPMEENVPLIIASDVAIEKKGWFEGQYAASGPSYTFSGDGHEKDFDGCTGYATKLSWGYFTCGRFRSFVRFLHKNEHQEVFPAGLMLFRNEIANLHPSYKERTDLFDQFSWDLYQKSDGLVSELTSLKVCDYQKNAEKLCTRLPLNHLANAGASSLLQQDVIEKFRKFSPQD